MSWDSVIPVALIAGFILLWFVVLPRLGVPT